MAKQTKEKAALKAISSAPPLQSALRLAALALLLLAAWLGYGAVRQWQSEQRHERLLDARDRAASAVQRAVATQSDRIDTLVRSAELQQALAQGDAAAIASRLKQAWPQIESAAFWPDLQAHYQAMPDVPFGELAAAEETLANARPSVRAVKTAEGARVVAATAVASGDNVRGVVLARLPLTVLTQPINDSNPGGGYLALRHGAYTIAEKGDMALSGTGESLAVPIKDSGMRLAAAEPYSAPAAMSALMALIAAALAAAAAAAAWVFAGRLGAGTRTVADIDDSPTLADALIADPLPQPLKPDPATATPKPLPIAVDRDIFRAYDIRGIVGKSLDAGVAERIGQAIGSLMREQDLPDIVVGRDGRLSGPELVAGLIAGLRKAGRNVIDIGMVPTPVVYFGSYHLRTGCCVSVTGSHNPPDYNGFKIVVGGETLAGEAITDLHARIAEGHLYEAASQGMLSERDISQDYVDRIASDVQTERRLKVVVDAGNGVAGEIGPRVLEAIGAEVSPLFCEIDGTFPNHHPDPSEPHNLEDLVRMVQRLDADLGIAFDGDGDRLGVVTRDGQNIFPDRLLMLFAADVLERNPGAMIIYDVKCTGHLPGYILRHGGSPLMWKTGHSLIKAKMRETHAELAGEMSGHFFFGERWYGFDDGIYAAARLLEILSIREETPTEVLNALPQGVSTPEIKVAAPGGDPHAFVERFVHTAVFDDTARRADIDGLRVDWPDGWGLVRASNTTPVLVLRFDADNADALARIQQAFREQLLAVDPELPLEF